MQYNKNNTNLISDYNSSKIIIYDGKCMLCSKSIAFITQRDKKEEFEYLSYRGTYAQKLLDKHTLDFTSTQYIVYINKGKHHIKSRAILEILRELGGIWSLLYIFIIVPPFIRNFIYDIIAKNRNRWVS